MDCNDKYFILNDNSSLSDLPQKLLKQVYNVRTKAEWEKLGYKINVNGMGMPERDRNLKYYFSCAKESEDEIIEAIKTGKKGTRNPLVISQLYELGIKFDEFIKLTEDIPLYCMAALAAKNGNIIDAFSLIEKAITYKNIPDYAFCRYMEIYFSTGRKMGKIELLAKELDYLENDMSTFVHSSIEPWIDIIIKYQQFDMIEPMFVVVKDGLKKILDGKTKEKSIYGQDLNWVKGIIDKLPTIEEKCSKKIEQFKKYQSGKEIKANEVCGIIYDFVQNVLKDSIGEQKYYPEMETKIFSLTYEQALNNNIIEKLNKKERGMLCLLLSQYIMFLTNNENLKFPSWFLYNKKKDTIPFNILLYILEHKWPYPQMLNKN